jgi:ABC-type nitrate/sulfonate/bicarbonate transport system substrate-binding protein
MRRHTLAVRCALFVWATAIAGLLLSTAAQAQKFEVTPVTEKKVAQLPAGALFWRIDTFPTLDKAQAVAGPTALAAEVDGKAWLFTLGPAGGSSPGGTKVAEIGRVPPINAPEYLLRVVQSGGPPGAKTSVHTHPGSETFYVLSGELTQKKPDGVMHVAAGQPMPGHLPNTPMQVSSTGTGELRALVMFVNDATKPFSSPAVFPTAAATPDASAVVIRYLDDRGYVPPYELAEALGWLKGTDIRLEQEGDSPGGPESLAALASGKIDIAGAATPAIINAIAGGAKILCVMPRAGISKDVDSKFFVLDDSSIKAATNLNDKSIAVNTLGAHLDYTVREYLRVNGLKTDEVKLIAIPGPRLDQTLHDRAADVVAVGAWQGPIAAKIASEGGVRVLFTDHDVLGDIVLASNAMERSFIDQHPEAVKALVTASAKAVDWATQHPDDAKKLVAQILKSRGEDPAGAATWPGYGLARHALYSDHDTQFWLDVLVREGKLKPGQFRPEDIATNKYNSSPDIVQH